MLKTRTYYTIFENSKTKTFDLKYLVIVLTLTNIFWALALSLERV